MHTLVVREPLYREQPWIAESLFKAFVQAKEWCLTQMRFSQRAALHALEEVFAPITIVGE